MRWVSRVWWRLVRFGFRLLYYELAFTYDIVSKTVSLGAWRCWQRTALKYLASAKTGMVLELAHGTGDFQLDLKGAGYSVIGCDLSPHMGRIARQKLHKGGLPAELTQCRAQALPFASMTFHAVAATFPTEFAFKTETLQEVHRVLIEGGCFVIVLSGIFRGGGVAAGFLEWLYRITGQRGLESNMDEALNKIKSQFHLFGFEAEIEQEECPRSRVILIVARKVVLPNSRAA